MRFFNIHSVAKHQKIERGPFGEVFFEKKSHNAEKTEDRDGMVMLRGKRRKPVLVHFARPNDAIWDHKIY